MSDFQATSSLAPCIESNAARSNSPNMSVVAVSWVRAFLVRCQSYTSGADRRLQRVVPTHRKTAYNSVLANNWSCHAHYFFTYLYLLKFSPLSCGFQNLWEGWNQVKSGQTKTNAKLGSAQNVSWCKFNCTGFATTQQPAC